MCHLITVVFWFSFSLWMKFSFFFKSQEVLNCILGILNVIWDSGSWLNTADNIDSLLWATVSRSILIKILHWTILICSIPRPGGVQFRVCCTEWDQIHMYGAWGGAQKFMNNFVYLLLQHFPVYNLPHTSWFLGSSLELYTESWGFGVHSPSCSCIQSLAKQGQRK